MCQSHYFPLSCIYFSAISTARIFQTHYSMTALFILPPRMLLISCETPIFLMSKQFYYKCLPWVYLKYLGTQVVPCTSLFSNSSPFPHPCRTMWKIFLACFPSSHTELAGGVILYTPSLSQHSGPGPAARGPGVGRWASRKCASGGQLAQYIGDVANCL